MFATGSASVNRESTFKRKNSVANYEADVPVSRNINTLSSSIRQLKLHPNEDGNAISENGLFFNFNRPIVPFSVLETIHQIPQIYV